MVEFKIYKTEIVKATLKNNMKEVYRLQEEIVVSFEGRVLAIRRVVTSSVLTQNPWC